MSNNHPKSSIRIQMKRQCWQLTIITNHSKKYASTAGINVESRDISLAGRILANFPEYLTEEQKLQMYLQN